MGMWVFIMGKAVFVALFEVHCWDLPIGAKDIYSQISQPSKPRFESEPSRYEAGMLTVRCTHYAQV